ncbi:Sin3 associated polypeptide p18-domain-containing protein [Irpex lacteus]|nr:Sin3 associated polypeptide p18-domain-containing protein [Irpex lacteus]
MEDTTPAGKPIVDREKTAPFLIRAFIKVGAFHRLTQFEDGPLPITDEQQIFTWRDATLREVLTTLRSTAPPSTEYRHPLARYSFRAVYADSANRGRAAQKDLGTVYSRDILGEPGTLTSPPLVSSPTLKLRQHQLTMIVRWRSYVLSLVTTYV